MFSVSEHLLPCDALFSRISDSRSKPLVGFGGRDASIHVFPFTGYTRTAWLQGFTEPVTALAFDSDQTSVIGGSDAGKLQMWDLNSEEVVRTFSRGHTSTVTDIDMFRSGQFFATVSTDKILRVWDVRKSSGRQSYKDASAPLCAVQFSPNGRWIATGCARGVVRLYDLVAGKLIKKLEKHAGAITSLHFHPDLYYLSAASGDGTVSMWDLDSFETRFHSASQHTPVDAVRFCGSHLLATSDHNLRVYDMTNLCDRAAVSLEAPWMMVGDVAYAAAADEAWFVEMSGSTAMKCRLSLRDIERTATDDKPPDASSPLLSPPSQQPHVETPSPAVSTSSPLRSSTAAALNTNVTPVFGETKRKLANAARARGTPTKPTSISKEGLGDIKAMSGKVSREPSPPPTTTSTKPPWISGGPSFPTAAPSSLSMHNASELQVVEQLFREGGTASVTLQSRLNTLHIVRSLWAQSQPEAIAHLKRLYEEGHEFGPLFDFLTVMQQQRMKEKLAVEAFVALIELVEIALSTDYEPLILLGLRTVRSLLTRFRTRVEEVQRRSRSAQSTGHNDPLGVAQHERIADKLSECSKMVRGLAERDDVVGEEARLTAADMPQSSTS